MNRLNPDFTEYVPRTAEEAVALFWKKKRLGHIKWDDLDITMRELARGLDQEQFDIFVKWITNPSCEPVGTLPDCFPKSGYVERTNSPHTMKLTHSPNQEDEKHPA